MILDEIVAHKRQEVARDKQAAPIEDLERAAALAGPSGGIVAALRRSQADDPLRVIAEIKKASPSKGLIRPDFRPADFATSYEANGAAAVSVLTDEKFFQGSLDILREARMATSLPILRKEFIIDPYQIVESRVARADAILLIAAVLTDEELLSFREEAKRHGMDALVEVHTADEARRAADSGARIVGVNNRDLRTFETDVRHTEQILPHLPDGAILVSESGIRDRDDVAYLQSLDIDAILVGESLMRQDDPGEALAELIGTD